MVRKVVFEKEDIVAAGLAVVERKGMDRLTARSVARQLGSSTAPVYSNFQSMEGLQEAVMARALELLLEESLKPRTGNAFLNMGLGVLQFALDHPHLYDALFLCGEGSSDPDRMLMENFLDRMAAIPELAQMEVEEHFILLRKLAVFTHGLASEICCGRLGADDMPMMMVLMGEVGMAVVAAAHNPPARTDQERELLLSMVKCSGGGRFVANVGKTRKDEDDEVE
ncbi:MAG: TetR/AcrR family transcriptional regulator [Candidatus Krumholzibacteriia bacterium]